MAQDEDPVSWLLREPKIILAALAFAFWVFQKIAGEKKKMQARTPDVRSSAEEAVERTRRVQADVQRKILERRAQRPLAPPVVAPRPIASPTLSGPFMGRLFEPPLADSEPTDDAEDRAIQERLLEQERLLAAAKVAAAATPKTVYVVQPFPTAMSTSFSENWGQDLRQPGNARRAIVLREILGPPISLKGFSY